jgi:uncharacterized phage-associated protein
MKGVIFVSYPIYASNNFIVKAGSVGADLTHLKLQKLLYILYARILARDGTSLFSDRFEAWKYGPVLTEIYGIFRDEGAKQLKDPQQDARGKIFLFDLTDSYGDCFNEVWTLYGWRSASDLVDLTHTPGSAWKKAVARDGGELGGFLEDEHIEEDGRRWF